MQKVSKDIGFQEVVKWLDFKKVSDNKREAQKDTIETLAAAISEGCLVLKDDCSLEMELKFPTDGEEPLTKLTFKPRLKAETVAKHLQGVKGTDIDGRLSAYIAALTAQTKTLIGKLDTEDQSLAQAIAVFFV